MLMECYWRNSRIFSLRMLLRNKLFSIYILCQKSLKLLWDGLLARPEYAI